MSCCTIYNSGHFCRPARVMSSLERGVSPMRSDCKRRKDVFIPRGRLYSLSWEYQRNPTLIVPALKKASSSSTKVVALSTSSSPNEVKASVYPSVVYKVLIVAGEPKSTCLSGECKVWTTPRRRVRFSKLPLSRICSPSMMKVMYGGHTVHGICPR